MRKLAIYVGVLLSLGVVAGMAAPNAVPIANVMGMAARNGTSTIPLSLDGSGNLLVAAGAGGGFSPVPVTNYTGLAGLNGTNWVPLSVDGTGALIIASTPGTVTFDQIGSGTNLGHGLVCGAGCVLSGIGGGFVSANEINGAVLPVSATSLATNASGQVVPGAVHLSGTTAAIGGSVLAAGACSAGTVTITGAATTMVATASPSADPSPTLTTGVSIYAFVSAANTVTVRVCALAAVTPAAVTYNVRVLGT